MDIFHVIGIIFSVYIVIGILVGYIEYKLQKPKDMPLFAIVIMCIFIWPLAVNEHFKDWKNKDS